MNYNELDKKIEDLREQAEDIRCNLDMDISYSVWDAEILEECADIIEELKEPSKITFEGKTYSVPTLVHYMEHLKRDNIAGAKLLYEHYIPLVIIDNIKEEISNIITKYKESGYKDNAFDEIPTLYRCLDIINNQVDNYFKELNNE